MRAVRRVAFAVLYALVALALTVAMFLVHVETAMGRTAVRDVANAVLAGAFRGRLHIGEVTELRLNGRLVARGVTLTDAEGRLIAEDGVLVAEPVMALRGALMHPGRAPMPRASLHVRVLRFLPDPHGLPSIADAFEPRHPGLPSRDGTIQPAPMFRFPSLELVVDSFENHLLVPAVATGLVAHGALDTEPLAIGAALNDGARAAATLTSERTPPLALRGSFDWQARFVVMHRGDPPEDQGRMHAVADLAGEHGVRCHVELLRDHGDTRVTVDGCDAPAALIDRASGAHVGLDASLAHAELAHVGPPSAAWTLDARGAVQLQGFALHAVVGPGDDATADVTLAHTDLARIRPGFPLTDLDGTLVLERHGQRLVVDTSRMTASVEHTRVPPVHASATLHGTRLALDRLAIPELGIDARGEVDLAHPEAHAWAEVRLTDADLARVPIVRRDVHGVFSGEARAELANGVATGRFALRGRGIRAQGISIASGEAHGALGFERHTPWLDAELRASGVVAGGNGPLEVRAHLAGNPQRGLDGHVHADASAAVARGRFPGGAVAVDAHAPTAVDGAFHVGVRRDRLQIDVPGAAVSLRGARGTVRANVTVPIGAHAGAVNGRARIDIEGGGVAEVGIHGTDLSGRFQGFPLAWAGRVLGTTAPLTGTLEGDLGILTDRAGSPRGTLRWTGGHLPVIGDFDLEVRANHEREVSELGATLTFGPDRRTATPALQHRVEAVVHVIPPRNLGDLPGWLAGLREADVRAHNLPASMLESALPRVARVEGAADATLVAHRARADEPLEAVLGFDARNVALGWSLAAALPDALQSLLRVDDPRRARGHDDTRRIVVPMRARGAICTRIADRALDALPIALDAVVARETGEPVEPLPTSCTDPTIAAVREPLVHASGAVRGRWFDAISQTLGEYATAAAQGATIDGVVLTRRTLEALTTVRPELTVELTVDSAHWPFVAENIRPIVRSLAHSPVPGNVHATVTLGGSLAAPTVDATLDARTTDIDALVGHDEAAATAHVTLTPVGPPTGPLGRALIAGTADARLIAHSGTTTHDAGTAHADVLFAGVLARFVNPDEGFRQADFRRFEITTSALHVGQLRWARSNNVQGLLTLRVAATGDPTTPLRADAEVTHFSARTEQSLAARVDGFLRNNGGVWELQACGAAIAQDAAGTAPGACDPDAPDLPDAPAGGMRTAIILPFNGPIAALDPDATGVHLELAANRMRLEPISPFVQVSPIVRIGGELTTRLSWAASSPRVITGHVAIADGLLDLETIGAPARDIALDIDLHARHGEISRVSFGLGTGTVHGQGTAQIAADGDRLVDLALSAHADRLPALREGNNYGEITGDVAGELSFRTDGIRGSVRVARAQVLVPAQSSRELQNIDPNPDVFVMGETRINAHETAHPYPIDLDVVTERPVIAARNDLYIGANANLHIHFDPAGLALSGSLTQGVPNSWFNIFGKRFDFDRVAITFDGSTVFDPLLDITAHYDSPSAGRINMLVSGRESHPDITFGSEQYPDLGQSEVLALLILGRQDTRGAADQNLISQQAQDAAASLLTGLLAGIGTNALRQQFDFLPQIIAEPGANGTGRYGAEVTTLDGRLYIEGAYVSGSAYSGTLSSSSQTSNTSQEFRLLTEYTLSRHWSVSGQAGTSQRYGADLFWSP